MKFTTVLAAAALALLAGCTATRGAYQAADNPAETAYVVTEHYAAVLHEAADLVSNANTPADVKQLLKDLTAKATPLVKQLRPLADAYVQAAAAVDNAGAVDSADQAAVAKAQADLSQAVAQAVKVVAELTRQVRAVTAAPSAANLNFAGGVA